jgi:tight adherence protein B
MRALRLVAAGVLLGAAPVLGLASPSYAAEEAQVSHVEPADDGVRILVSVSEGARPDLDGVTVTLNGSDAPATAEPVEGAAVQVERTTVLAIDTSKSMQGRRFAAAKAAAVQFLEEVPADVEVGIVTFDSTVETALAPTTDRDAARAAIDGLTLALQTRLYDGVIAAADLAGEDGQRQVLLLSDGANTNGTPIDDVVTALEESGVGLDAVALNQNAGDTELLQQMADAADGTVIPADPQALSAAFAAQASLLARQVLVIAEIPSALTVSEATLEVTIPSRGETLTASAYSRIRQPGYTAPAPLARSDDGGIRIPQSALYAGLAALALGLMILLSGFMSLLSRQSGPVTMEDRIAAFGASPHTAQPAAASATSTLDSAKDAAASMLQRNRGLEAKIEHRLESAGSPLKPAEWLLVHATVVLVGGLVGLLLSNGSILMALVGLGVGYVLPRLWLGHKRKKRVAAFNAGLADTLQLISGSLSAGMSLAQSLDAVVNEGNEPIAGEFRRVLIESRLGVPVEASLEGIAQRLQSQDFAWVVMAIRIQREVGGNLAELLTTVSATLREREYLRRQVKTLSAEGKLSAYILVGLPIGMLFYMLAFRRDFVMPLFTELLGLVLFGVGCVLLSLGWFMMSKIVKVEV